MNTPNDERSSPRPGPLWQPMTHPGEAIQHPPRTIVAGEGVHVTDAEGRRYLDALAGGLWNVNLGFSCEPVKRAIANQLDVLPYYSAFRGTVAAPAVELAERIIEWTSPEGMGRVFFTSGGSDSVETALRLARQYHKLRGQPGRVKFLSLTGSYHGTHFGGASVTGNARFRTPYEPLLPGTFHIPGPNTYRNDFDEADPARLAARCLTALESQIVFQGPQTVAAFIMEPIQGAGGVYVPHESFMPGVRDICSRHGVLLIADEVITGFGRSGAWFGSRLWGVQPDMMTIAKALTTGYFPLGATLISHEVAEEFESNDDGLGAVMHGYTYSGHPVGAAAGLATLEETARLGVVDNAASRGSQLFEGVTGLADRFDVVGDVRGGHGLAIALELVSDRPAKTPLDGTTMARIHEAVFDAGVAVRLSGNKIILSPALIIGPDHVARIVDALAAGLESV
ncbi:MAG: aminotransferase class III-fold pyridoxal phosphate-dependent enzyme [Actinomycetia bacterium]|nr:aminotransferase class III-fold pyridoxal phosphate-dependent enzyme [Actinomycetes bacterium]